MQAQESSLVVVLALLAVDLVVPMVMAAVVVGVVLGQAVAAGHLVMLVLVGQVMAAGQAAALEGRAPTVAVTGQVVLATCGQVGSQNLVRVRTVQGLAVGVLVILVKIKIKISNLVPR